RPGRGPGEETQPMDRRTTLALGVIVALVTVTGCAGTRAAWTPPAELEGGLAVVAPDETPAGRVLAADDELVGEIEFHSFDLRFEPTSVTVDAPGRYRVTLVNEGVILHDITFDDGTIISA